MVIIDIRNTCLFSRDEATLYECVSVSPSAGPSLTLLVTFSLFGLLGATHGVTRPCYEAKAETAEEAEGGEVTEYPLPPLIEEPLTATTSPEQKQ